MGGRPAGSERVNHTARWGKRVPGGESASAKPQNLARGGAARRPGLWLSGQVAGGEVGDTAKGWPVTSVLSCCFRLRTFAVCLQPPFPLVCPHTGLCTLEGRPCIPVVFTSAAPCARPGVAGECSIYDKSAPFFFFFLFFFFSV